MAQINPLHILIASLAGLINRQQAEVLKSLIEENRVLKDQIAATDFFYRFRIVMEVAGIKALKTPCRAPNANAQAELA